MSYVDLNIKDFKRLLSILSEYFGTKSMNDADKLLKQKLEVMYNSEVEWEDDA